MSDVERYGDPDAITRNRVPPPIAGDACAAENIELRAEVERLREAIRLARIRLAEGDETMADTILWAVRDAS
jgi:predicted nucleotidyltransferase